MKNAIMQVTYVLNGSLFNLLFYYHIILYWETVTSYEKFSHNLTLNIQIFWKIWNIEMLKNSWISKNFNYNEKLYNILQGPNSDPP